MVAGPALPRVTEEFDWNSYYETAPYRGPSPFAAWLEPQLPRRSRIIDLGAGDGRDAVYFAEWDHHVTAVDISETALRRIYDDRVEVRCEDATRLATSRQGWDIAYIRWFLHTVPEDALLRVLTWCARNVDAVAIEARSDKGEHPTDHYRRPLSLAELITQLRTYGFRAVYAREAQGLSPEGDNDPWLLRVLAR